MELNLPLTQTDTKYIPAVYILLYVWGGFPGVGGEEVSAEADNRTDQVNHRRSGRELECWNMA